MKYLVNITSFDGLKKLYREMAMKLHPDMGGSDEEMQVLNNEYDVLFPIWKNRTEVETGVHTQETADGDRIYFYTQNGWAGKNYKCGRTTKEIAQIIRTYLKEAYSDCKWSVRYSSYSGGSSIHVSLMEAPYCVFKDENKTHGSINHYHFDRDENYIPKAHAMLKDVLAFIESYHYDDSDGMIDYFCTNFYYDLSVGTWDKPFKVVYREPKKPDNRVYETVVVKETKSRKVKKAQPIERPAEIKVGQHFKLCTGFNYGHHRGNVYEITKLDNGHLEAMKMGRKLDKHVTSISQRGNCFRVSVEKFQGWLLKQAIEFVNIVDEVETYEVEKTVKRPVKPDMSVDAATEIGKYTVNEDVDTRDQSKIWVVKIVETLDKEAFNTLRGKMKELGGYYSRFKKGFLFRDDPTEQLNEVFA